MLNLTEGGSLIQGMLCTRDLLETHKNVIISSLNIPLSITALLGNVLIIVALQKPSSLHPPSKLLLGCLAVADLLVGVITQPLWVAYLLFPQYSKRCQVIQFLLGTIGAAFGGVSLMTLTAISVDRLLALKLGLRYRHVMTTRRVRIFVATSWLSVAAIAALYAYNFRILARSIASTAVMSCIAILTFCYLKIYFKLRHHEAAVQENQDGPQRQSDVKGIPLNIARYKKTMSGALWVQVTLLVCYLPYGIISFVRVSRGYYTPSLALGSAATLSILLLNSSLNPFLYRWKMREVRRAVKDTIRQLWCF